MLTALNVVHHPRSPSSPASSLNSRALLSTSPSVSSTFSDISVSSLPSVPSPCISPGTSSTSIPATPPTKTSAFFGSPFSTRPPSPAPPHHHHHKSSSLDSVPIHQDPASLSIPTRLPPLSRLFPSRYLTDLAIDAPNGLQHERDFLVLDTEHLDTPLISSPIPCDAGSTPRPPSRVPSLSSSPSSTSTSASLPLLPSADPAYYPDSTLSGSIISSHVSDSDVSPGPPHITTLTLVRTLGQGAFSSVWLAEDVSVEPLSAPARVGAHPRGAHIAGTSPVVDALARPRTRSVKAAGSDLGHGGVADVGTGAPRLVAVKITPRVRGQDRDRDSDRTRVGFVREVEVLRHIAHPNITALLGAFSTPTHHVLVLPHLVGGDLLTLVNNDSTWSALRESTLQRMWCELCNAVAWMHSVGLVHRDIKLENILLVAPIDPLPPLPQALTQLGDFGLARFVDPRAPRLRTRCGSEAYAAPELVIAGHGYEQYDARATDAWACGVVLFAVCARRLPFGEGVGADVGGGGIRGELGGRQWYGNGNGEAQPQSRRRGMEGEMAEGKDMRAERRRWLMRIARGEYEWPSASASISMGATATATAEVTTNGDDSDGELRGLMLVESAGARRIVGRLLVRDPTRRAAVGELWEDEWMREGNRVEGRLVDWEDVDRVVCQEVV